MAFRQDVNCDNCDYVLSVWPDANYYYWSKGQDKNKVFVHFPSDEMSLVVGAEVENLCLDCAQEFRVDSEAPVECCPKCYSPNISDMRELDGKLCPFCHEGHFVDSPETTALL